MKTFTRIMLGAVGVLGLTSMSAQSAQSATDQTPPVLTVAYKSSFVTGVQMAPGYHPDCYPDGQPWTDWEWVPQDFTWSATDDSTGPIHYDVFRANNRDGGSDVVSGSTQTSHSDEGTNADQSCGGGDDSAAYWDLTARDGAGNTTVKRIFGGQIEVTQDSNLNDGQGNAVVPVMSYAGAWQSASCSCWSGGGVHKTKAKNASVSIKVTLPYGVAVVGPEAGNRSQVALVMHRGVGRGEFQVWVNGELRSTVDTYSKTEIPRSVVYQTEITGTTTIKVVNLATAGRPRIDLDAVLTN